MGNIFGNLVNYNFLLSNDDEIKPININLDNLEEISCQKKEEVCNNLENLEKRNIRNLPIITTYKHYAPDIKIIQDYDNIKRDLNKFVLLSSETGFTSVVHIYEYNGYKIVEKKYKNVDLDSKWYVDNNFIRESFLNELSALILLQEEDIVPKILMYDEGKMKIIMEYNGEKISDKNENINLATIPPDWKLQMYYILRILKKYNLYHNDITCRNLCMKNNKIVLIDFGNCKKCIDLYYRNYYTDLILNSDNIIDFFNSIDHNAYEIRKCQMDT